MFPTPVVMIAAVFHTPLRSSADLGSLLSDIGSIARYMPLGRLEQVAPTGIKNTIQ